MRYSRQGFTLTEMLVVMAILSLVIMAVSDIYVTGLQRWGVIYTRTAGLQQINTAMEKLKEDIGNAIACVPEYSGSNVVYTFILPAAKDSGGAWIPSVVNAGLIYPNGSRVRYYLSDSTGSSSVTGGNILWRATAPNGSTSYTPDSSWSMPGGRALCGNVQTFSLSIVNNPASVAVLLSLSAQVTDGGKTTNYSLDRTIRLACSNAEILTFRMDPRSTFLRVNSDPYAELPRTVDLAGRGISPGDKIRIEILGGYSTGGGAADNSSTITNFVFASSSVVQAFNLAARVAFPIASTAPGYTSPSTRVGGLTTDIPQDFAVSTSAIVTVPTNALFLLIGVPDNFNGDNTDANGDFAVRITKL
jgi:prepilin-type N-terminal cleavage/methylation domain-containing protein